MASLIHSQAPAQPLAWTGGADIGDTHYRLLAENLADALILNDEDGRILDVNQRTCETTGYSRDQLLGMRVWDISTVPEARLRQLWSEISPGQQAVRRSEHRRKDGPVYPTEIRITCLERDGRKLFFALVRNITVRLEAVQALQRFDGELAPQLLEQAPEWRRSSELLQAVMDGAADIIYIKDTQGRYLLFNRAAQALVAKPAEEVLGRSALDLFGPETARSVDELEQKILRDGVPVTLEETLATGGEKRTFLATRSPYRNIEGEIVGFIGIMHDITEMRRAEQALRESETRWQFAVDGAGDGIWDWNVATGHVFYSRRWKAMLGHAEAEVGDTLEEWSGRVHPDDLAGCWAIVESHFNQLTPDFSFEHRMRAKDGSWRWILDRGKAVERDADGKPARVIGTHTDITERKLNEDELQLQRERLLAATEASRLGVWDLNPDTGALICDARLLRIFGLPASATVTTVMKLRAQIHPDDRRRVIRQQAQSLAEGLKIHRLEFRIVTPAGDVRWISSAARLIERSESGPRRLVGIVMDVTGERQAAETLRQAKEAAEAAERAKSDFLATMSHEIRTPMNTVIGMTRLTLNTDLTPKQRNYLEKIDASAKTLLAIINDILDFSKIEAGGLQLEETEFTLEQVLDSMSAINAARADEKGLEIVYAIAADAPRRLRGDPLRLGQVLTNLLSNAVKFTEAGEVVISIGKVSEADGEAVLQFSVRDTGIGLDAEQVAGLFRRFTQAEAHTSRRYGGTGLGLAISKQLVEMMGGEIWVESEPGQGSTFHFTIRAAVPEPALARAAQRSRSNLAGRRVLIVDDNASAREILSDMVRGFGMYGQAVESGLDALATLREASRRDQPFDLVLMDWRMPTLDGLETARLIRAEGDHLSRMPAVLMVTAYGREEVIKSAEQLGLHGVLIKPVTESVMFNTLQDILVLASRGAMDGGFAGAGLGEGTRRGGAPEARELAALKGLKVLVVDDNALNREVATDFLLAVGIEVETAVNGKDALKQLNAGAYDAVLMDVHMPEMDGLSAVREIRKQAGWAELPIIALTAQARVEDRSASLDAGMNAHLTKPIDETQLYRTLMQVLGLHPAAAEPVEGGGASAARDGLNAALLGFDAPAALKRFGDDAARLQRLLQGFLRDFDTAVERFDGLLQASDMAGVAALAHALRGAAAYLEANAFCVVADQVENAARKAEGEAVLAYAPIFRSLLDALLRQIRETCRETGRESSREIGRAAVAPAAARPVGVDLAELLRLAAEAGPLIARGDYAAQSLLDQLCNGLAGRPEAALADQARTHYEDLELEAANAALEQLNASLRAGALQDRP